MKSPHFNPPVIGLLAALCVALGHLLAAVPNIELLTTGVFISGYWTGMVSGIAVGGIAIGLYSMLNPYGMAPPPLFVAQILSYTIVGGVAGVLGRRIRRIGWKAALLFAACGLCFTVLYALLTTLAYVLTAGNHRVLFWGSLIQGLGFYVTHMITNTVFFFLLVPFILNRLDRLGWTSELRGSVHE
ncbi:MAG TPA: ECF transporter S component [bacterium]|nr:ECF transporter S component [bacterium]